MSIVHQTQSDAAKVVHSSFLVDSVTFGNSKSISDNSLQHSCQSNHPEITYHTHHDLLEMIQTKNRQIDQLNSTITQLRQQNWQKTNQVQLLKLSIQKVQQQPTSKVSPFKNHQLLRHRLILSQQVNDRQYFQNLELENNIKHLKQQIEDFKQKLKIQESTSAIKIGEINLELIDVKKKNQKLQKQVKYLMAVLKELQSDGDSCDSQKQQSMTLDSFGSKRQSSQSNNNGSISFMSGDDYSEQERHVYYNEGLGIDESAQEQIVFM